MKLREEGDLVRQCFSMCLVKFGLLLWFEIIHIYRNTTTVRQNFAPDLKQAKLSHPYPSETEKLRFLVLLFFFYCQECSRSNSSDLHSLFEFEPVFRISGNNRWEKLMF